AVARAGDFEHVAGAVVIPAHVDAVQAGVGVIGADGDRRLVLETAIGGGNLNSTSPRHAAVRGFPDTDAEAVIDEREVGVAEAIECDPRIAVSAEVDRGPGVAAVLGPVSLRVAIDAAGAEVV